MDYIKSALSEDFISMSDQFSILSYAIDLHNSYLETSKEETIVLAREIALRCLDVKGKFSSSADMLESISIQLGYYPYVESTNLSLSYRIAASFHSPIMLNEAENESIVFHREQFEIYQKIIHLRKNIILSAPTSFGKSIIVDAVLADNIFSNILVLVPTISLIDEIRNRLIVKFSDRYNVVSHYLETVNSQNNIIILTPERFNIIFDRLPCIDFCVIEEFYKIQFNNKNTDDERVIALNEAFYSLYKRDKPQFFMIGPNIQSINIEGNFDFDFEFINTSFQTVISEVIICKEKSEEEKLKRLYDLCKSTQEQTIIYCNSPKNAFDMAINLLENDVVGITVDVDKVTAWLSDNYHPDWILTRCVSCGIGIHIGPLPRTLTQNIIRLFNEKRIQFLICTSTIIEGVNTSAKNVIIYNNKIARKKLDFFTFNNIKGRAGRMFKHFIGRVYTFGNEPKSEITSVEFPVINQSDSMPDQMLLQISQEDLTVRSKQRLDNLQNNKGLPFHVFRDNHGIAISKQIKLYHYLNNNVYTIRSNLQWKNEPSWDELKFVCELVWKYLAFDLSNSKSARRVGPVTSSQQLAFFLKNIGSYVDVHSLAINRINDDKVKKTLDEIISDILAFSRNWANYNFPRYLMALDRIQHFVLSSHRLEPGDYSYYSAKIENLGLPSYCSSLDEFGIPIQVSKKLRSNKSIPAAFDWDNANLSDIFEVLSKLTPSELSNDPFEQELLDNALKIIRYKIKV